VTISIFDDPVCGLWVQVLVWHVTVAVMVTGKAVVTALILTFWHFFLLSISNPA